jgi:dienelactone hydrolase
MVSGRAFAFVLAVAATALLYVELNSPLASPFPKLKPQDVNVNVDPLIRVRTLEDVRAARVRTTQNIFGTSLPDAVSLPDGVMFVPADGDSSKLAIYHGGHDQNAADSPTVGILQRSGYDVYAISMPAGDHGRFAAEKHPLRPFLEPVAHTLNYAMSRRDYSEVIMAGLSGGGWTTVVYSAIDPRIQRSYPIAGSVPEHLRRLIPKSIGDYEQTLPGLDVGYLDLYVMAASDGREQMQLFNRQDPCCFSGDLPTSYRKAVRRRAEAVGGRFDVVVSDHAEHELSPDVAALLWPRAREIN